MGALALATTAGSLRRYRDPDLVLAREIAERAALALDNARLYAEVRSELASRRAVECSLRDRYRQLRVLYEMTEAVGRAGALDQVFEQALEGLQRALGVERASILLFDSDGVMQFTAWRGLSQEYRDAVSGHSPWTADARNPQPIVVGDAAGDASLSDDLRAAILEEGIRGLAFIPLVFSGQLLGKFMLYSDQPRVLGDDEVELALAIAGTIAFAITRMRDELTLREARETAERANATKAQFLGIMSHELRTPLNAVLGYAELLLLETRGPINAAQRVQLERIQAGARHQLGLVEEILTYARLDAGREEPRMVEIDARRVLKDVVELVRPVIDVKGLSLTVEVPERPLTLATDPARLRQILLNLVDNAMKYTPQGGVTLRARAHEGVVQAEVSDTGPGIPSNLLDYIFEPFARVDESLTRSTPGTGLGLAITRQLAELLGGSVTVVSVPGAGTTFTVSLPAPTSGSAADAPAV